MIPNYIRESTTVLPRFTYENIMIPGAAIPRLWLVYYFRVVAIFAEINMPLWFRQDQPTEFNCFGITWIEKKKGFNH